MVALTAWRFVVDCGAMTRPSNAPPPHYRRNFVAFVVDYVFFSVAMSFASPSSVLPAFVRQFTRSAPVIGLVSTIFNGCWLLPQVVAARAINDKSRKKPYLMIGISGRITFWITALGLWLGLAQRPNEMLLLIFGCLGMFTISDGLASVAWFDMLARAIPLQRRGRLMGIAQVIGGLAGALPPLLGWTAMTGQLSVEGVLLVMIIFTWTPPHFWSLAIHRRKDYAKAKQLLTTSWTNLFLG